MNFLGEPLFQAIFNTSVPRIIVHNDAPHFTVITYNDAQKQISRAVNYNSVISNVWEAFGFNNTKEGNGFLLMDALLQAANKNEVVLTPAFNHTLYALDKDSGKADWWRIEVKPVNGKDGSKAEYLVLTTYHISGQMINHQTLAEKKQQEQRWNNELAALNEELAASYEELIASNEELLRSQNDLHVLNNELEQRINWRTQALAESEVRFRNLVQHAPVAIIVLNGPDMVIELANEKNATTLE